MHKGPPQPAGFLLSLSLMPRRLPVCLMITTLPIRSHRVCHLPRFYCWRRDRLGRCWHRIWQGIGLRCWPGRHWFALRATVVIDFFHAFNSQNRKRRERIPPPKLVICVNCVADSASAADPARHLSASAGPADRDCLGAAPGSLAAGSQSAGCCARSDSGSGYLPCLASPLLPSASWQTRGQPAGCAGVPFAPSRLTRRTFCARYGQIQHPHKLNSAQAYNLYVNLLITNRVDPSMVRSGGTNMPLWYWGLTAVAYVAAALLFFI